MNRLRGTLIAGAAAAAVFEVVTFMSTDDRSNSVRLLLVVRLPIHRRAGSDANRQRLLADDLGQVAAAAGSLVLLAYGCWPGAIPALATLPWLGLSARRSTQRKHVPLAALH